MLDHTEIGTVTIGIDAVLNGSVLPQGRPAPPGVSWSVPLSVTLHELSQTTDEYGGFVLGGIVPGD